jgi:transposase
MNNIPTRYQLRVKQRQRVIEYAETHGYRAASRHFGLARRTVRTWCRHWQAGGAAGLVPRYRERRQRRVSDRIIDWVRVARLEYRWGSTRTRIWLERVHQTRGVSPEQFEAAQKPR